MIPLVACHRVRHGCTTQAKVNDPLFVQQLRRGNADSWQAVVDKFRPEIHKRVRRKHPILQPEDADDLVQEIFKEATEKIARFDARYPFEAWLFTISHRRALDFFRKETRRRLVIQKSSEESWDEGRDDTELRERVDDAIAILSREQTTIIRLIYLNGFKCKEVAKSMGLPISSVRRKKSECLERLRRYCRGLGD